MAKRARLSPIGTGMLLLTLVAAAALSFGSSGVQIGGLVVLLLEVACVAVRPVFGPGLDGGWLALKTQGRAVPGTGPEIRDPAPDYMPRAAIPSEETWAHERELYREKGSADG